MSDDAWADAWAADSAGSTYTPRKREKGSGTGRRASMLEGYHLARQSAEARREDVTIGYATEKREYNRDVGMPTLTKHLKGWRAEDGDDWGAYH